VQYDNNQNCLHHTEMLCSQDHLTRAENTFKRVLGKFNLDKSFPFWQRKFPTTFRHGKVHCVFNVGQRGNIFQVK